jgi:hypothetical protein
MSDICDDNKNLAIDVPTAVRKKQGGRKSKRNIFYRKKTIIDKDSDSRRRKKSDKAKETWARYGRFSQKHVRIQEAQTALANQRNSLVNAEASGLKGK